ncbi:membrane protein [Yersinia aleksiciae]|uniref:Membrane protein n=1 Tax=Yersinia aleksiciae TaxID=263819 RepID=A0ABM5U8J8_YERAE|nr:membrane protein [Yersinia aleksiciae]AKP32134.1 membrane protein [Yersinia aleksiciae]CFQ34281.1 flagella biosynthesis regulator [Yersinia aleksiciae]
MDTEASKDRNRVAGRDFNEENTRIDQFVGRDLVNISIPHPPKDDRPLVPAQRKQLNQLVQEIVETGYEESFAIWQRVHAEIGVSSIEEMTVSHYQVAYRYLRALSVRYCDQEASKSLIHLLLKNTQKESERQQLIRYCHIQFGTGRLTELSRLQLQQALSWLDEKQYSEPISPTAPTSEKRLSWQQILRDHPIFTGGVFISGFLIAFLIVSFNK